MKKVPSKPISNSETTKNSKSDEPNRKPNNVDSKPAFQPETSHKKALSIYGGTSTTKTSVVPPRQSKAPIAKSTAKTTVGGKKETDLKKTDEQRKEELGKKRNIDKELLDKLPQELVLEILDYYVGPVFKACLMEEIDESKKEQKNLKSLQFNESLFYKQYFGKFKNRGGDATPKLIFKRAAIPHDTNRSAKEFHHLLTIVARSGKPIDPYFQILARLFFENRTRPPYDLEEKETKKLNYITKVLGKDKDLCEKFTEIDLGGVETFERAAEFAANNFPNIVKLKFGFVPMPTKMYVYRRVVDFSSVATSFCQLTKLKNISLNGHVDDVSLEELSKNAPLVEKLNIRNSSILKCGKAITNWKNLKEMYIDNKPDSNNLVDQTEFCAALHTLPSIEILSLHNEKICNSTFNRFPSTITFLDLSYSTISSQLFEGISGIESLKILCLDCSYGFQKDDFRHLKHLPRLEELSVSDSYLSGNIAVKHIAEIESLKRVYLQNSARDPINDEGGVALSKLTNLEIIDLQYSEITEKTVNAIINNCKNITKIHIDGCLKVKKDKFVPSMKYLLSTVSFRKVNVADKNRFRGE